MRTTPLPMAPTRARRSRRRQGGVATLIVVMLIFFVVSLAAAYASRNLIFEQRTSTNQYHSTQSLEAAEAGLEWALTMLNSGRIGDDCQPTNDLTKSNFRDRFLNLDKNPASATFGRSTPDPGGMLNSAWAACSSDGATWTCTCAGAALTPASLPTGVAAFSVRFLNNWNFPVNTPGLVHVEVNGCTSYNVGCVTAVAGDAGYQDCHSTLCSLAVLYSAVKSPPTAALTAWQSVTGPLAVYNQDTASGGIAIHAGGAVGGPGLVFGGPPGTPATASMLVRDNDPALSGLDADAGGCNYCTFSSTFGLRPDTYHRQPAMATVDCSATCAAADVNNVLAAGRSGMVWLKGAGGLTLSNAADIIGAAGSPVVLVIDGPLTITAAATSAATIYGLVYAPSASLASGQIRGALVSASTVVGSGAGGQVSYDATALSQLSVLAGSYVKVPGSWRDFP